MPVANVYKTSVLVTPGGQIYESIDQKLNPGIERAVVKGDGKLSPQFSAVMRQSPSFSASTLAIKAALDLMGLGPYSFSGAGNTCDFYLRRLVNGGTLSVASDNIKLSALQGIVVPKTLELQDKQPAKLTYEVWAVSSDGVTAPITLTTAVALPSLTAADQMYTLGPAKINGTAFGGIQSITIDFGLKVAVKGSEGEVYPTFVGIDEAAPKLRLKTYDATTLSSITLGGTAQGGTASTFYARKKTPNGLNVANGTAAHIKFTITTAGHFIPIDVSGSENNEASVEHEFNPLDDGTNAILALNTASTIV